MPRRRESEFRAGMSLGKGGGDRTVTVSFSASAHQMVNLGSEQLHLGESVEFTSIQHPFIEHLLCARYCVR